VSGQNASGDEACGPQLVVPTYRDVRRRNECRLCRNEHGRYHHASLETTRWQEAILDTTDSYLRLAGCVFVALFSALGATIEAVARCAEDLTGDPVGEPQP
jgi:hypothetical protein